MADNIAVIDGTGAAASFKTTDTGALVHQPWHFTQPFAALIEGGLTELVGINEQVDQNDYSGSVGVALGGTYSGEILSWCFYATEDGTGYVDVDAGDWVTDVNGGAAYIADQPLAFHALATLYFVWFHEDATSLNDGAGDDEQLQFNFWYRRDS